MPNGLPPVKQEGTINFDGFVPPELVFVIDCRIPVTVDLQQWEDTVNQWCKEAGEEVWIYYEQKQPKVPITKLDNSNPYWVAFKQATDELKINLKPRIFPGGTDNRYVRSVGLPAFGFSPMNNTPVLLHDHDEYLGVETFLKGIDIYCKIIPALANLEDKNLFFVQLEICNYYFLNKHNFNFN